MITGDIKSKVDRIWEIFWTGGVTNPLTVIEQFSYLLFIRELDSLQNKLEYKAKKQKKKLLKPIFEKENYHLRWSVFIKFTPIEMYNVVKEEVFPFIRTLNVKTTNLGTFFRNAVLVIPNETLLRRIIEGINVLMEDIPPQNKDMLGDLYEYLLSKLQTSGTNGQFRTPRHIVKLMVELIKPDLGDTVVDPAVGSAGFLVEAMQYIASRKRGNLKTVRYIGFDTDETMLRVGAMNMFLHGIENPELLQLNSISNENNAEELCTIVLANPPFKGYIDEASISDSLMNFVKTKKTELLFLMLILRLLKKGGRCAVIVPDGVLFGSSKANQNVRKCIVEQHKLEAIISMPSGVFKPYAGVSTAIMIFTKTNIGGTEHVWFYDMRADGFSLDDKRKQLNLSRHEENNLPDIINRFHQLNKEVENKRSDQSFLVPVSEIRDQDYNLSIKQYMTIVHKEVQKIDSLKIIDELKLLDKNFRSELAELEALLNTDKK
ncbi:SAM-dependent DNA methyltransferase [Paenibacillus sp. H1-7]|uniref:class I SAM-dependent DNA methyltransferase n=1 Tax=Paenibacillus sp. H1-7 TaxID=2282849 RepID=UPI001EF8FAE5|nr:class I SAM-dependent DNA methyltransferase [Paenibacillus sp. H1-7]ULL13046.1 SAM-dependent DNA methyltransferase [Paenibacillus sp. H1-7]